MIKSIFQTLDELNKIDSETGSQYVALLPEQNILSIDKKGNHGEIKFGCPPEISVRKFSGEDLRIICLIIDGKKFDEIRKNLTTCTDPLFTIEEVQERILKAASDAWDAAKESVVENACIEHDHVKNTEFVEVDYGVIEKDKQQFLEQLKQKK